MNRILFEEKASRYSLDPKDPRFEHVRGVLRMQAGDSFDVGVVNGPVGKALIKTLDRKKMLVEVEWGAVPPFPPDICLLVGMCRPASARRILATAPTLGLRKIIFSPSGRSDPAYAKSTLWNEEEWRKRLKEGVEQAFDTHLPALILPSSLKEALLDLPEDCVRLALDVYEGAGPLSSIPLKKSRPVCLAIGPERGWDSHDRRLLKDTGFDLVSIGRRVLRVDTAVTVALALVLRALGEV